MTVRVVAIRIGSVRAVPSATLSAEEARVVGVLIEKQLTTPQYYPLTMNALVAGCNQSSNRDPVVDYSEGVVEAALGSLRERGFARLVHPGAGSRVTKYRHVVDQALALDRKELALVCVLLLRGPQTVNELRTRTERMAEFDGAEDVVHDLERLARREEPLVVNIGRRAGQREERFATTLVEPDASSGSGAGRAASPAGSAPAPGVVALRPQLPQAPRITPLPDAEADEDQRSLLGSTDAAASNLFSTLVRHPGLFRRWLPFGGKLLRGGRLAPRLRELVILRTAHLAGAAYEWGHHVGIALEAGLTDAEIRRVLSGPDAGWSGLDALVLRACDEVHTHGVISDPTWRDLDEQLDQRSLMEVPFLIGHYRMLAIVIASLGIQPEPGQPPLPSPEDVVDQIEPEVGGEPE